MRRASKTFAGDDKMVCPMVAKEKDAFDYQVPDG
jgi:hypothetical protein